MQGVAAKNDAAAAQAGETSREGRRTQSTRSPPPNKRLKLAAPSCCG